MDQNTNTVIKKKKFEFPHSFVIVFLMIVLCVALSFILTPSQYDRVEVDGQTMVDADSFHYLERKPVNLDTLVDAVGSIFYSIPAGFVDAAALIFMMLFIGGFVKTYDSTGAIRAAITSLASALGERNKKYVLVAIMFFFGCLGAFPGMLEACIPFAPLTIGISIALGYDALIGIFVALGGITLGFCAGPTNIWNTGVGNELAELPTFSGVEYRLIVFVVFMIVASLWIVYYTSKISKDPSKSPIAGMDMSHLSKLAEYERTAFTTQHKIVLIVFALTIGVIVYGSFSLGWGSLHMAACYLVSAIICSIICRWSSDTMIETFLEGMRSILVGAVAVGMSRALPLVLEEGQIIDTIIHAVVEPLQGLPETVTAVLMMFVQSLLNFLMPSSAGQAAATLPLFLPIGDLVGLGRRVTILAFQFGDSLTNLIYPTYGGLIAFLMFAKIPYNKWVRFMLPFVVVITIVAAVLVAIADMIGF